jgi:hypothetical protein
MSRYLLITVIAVLFCIGVVYANCPRPAEIESCPDPAFIPYCRSTVDTQTHVFSCSQCHFEMWKRSLV